MSKDESSEGEPVDEGKQETPDEEDGEEEDNEEEDDYSSKLRSSKPRSGPTSSLPRGSKLPFRGKRAPLKRKRGATFSKGKKKGKSDWQDDKSSSDESYRHPDEPDMEVQPTIVQKFLYNPGFPWPDLSGYMAHMVEIRVAKEFLSFGNKEVSNCRLWGTDVYTSDSDIVAVIQHTGLIDIAQQMPEQYEGVAVYIRISKGRSNYVSTLKNHVRSKRCVNYEGHSIKPDKVMYLASLGTQEELREMASRMPTDFHRQRVKPVLNMKKRSLIPGVSAVTSLSFEEWSLYSLDFIGEKGDNPARLAVRLRSEVLYLETETERYELCRYEDSSKEAKSQDKFRWSSLKPPLLTKDSNFMSANRSPLDQAWVRPLHKGNSHTACEWSDIAWGSQYVVIKGVSYGPMKCVKFYAVHG
jgi:hypothetical protein